jgi:Protein of unknown function (DUF3300)
MRKALAVSLVLCLAYTLFAGGAATLGPSDAAAADPDDESFYQPFSPEQLDNLLAPIALYPDPLLAQVLPAATFVNQIDEAARWVRAYGTNEIDDQNWDISVKAVAHYPMVLYMMADKLDWTTAVGQAYVYQSTDVMASIQSLRAMANSQGNMISTSQQQVIVEGGYIQIIPAEPRYIYVPTYDPTVIFFRSAYFGGGFGGVMTFSSGFAIGAWLDRDCDWRGRRIFYTGWQGGGWIARSRPYVNITNVYVNNRYENIQVDRRIVNRTVNYTNINRYNSVHRNVTYENRVRNPAVGNSKIRVTNQVINRNMDTNDPRLDRYRGRETQTWQTPPPSQRPAPQPLNRPASQPPARIPPQVPSRSAPPTVARPQAQPAPNAFRKSEGGFDPRAASQRGKASRGEGTRPTAPSRPNAPGPAPSRPAAPPGRQP